MRAMPAGGGCTPSPVGLVGSSSPNALRQSRSSSERTSITPMCSAAAASLTSRGRSPRTLAVQLSSRHSRLCRSNSWIAGGTASHAQRDEPRALPARRAKSCLFRAFISCTKCSRKRSVFHMASFVPSITMIASASASAARAASANGDGKPIWRLSESKSFSRDCR
eukprot:scaffold66019_cov64-Phaeocystis_antarctica.AAC.5